MRTRWLLAILAVVMLLGIAFMTGVAMFLGTSSSEGDAHSFFGGKKIAVIEVEGTIMSGERTIEELNRARKDKGIRAVVLRIESPGGSVGASQEILEAVKRLAEEKPVVASMGSVAASGGYYIALGARKILANPGTITGSIGVRMEHVMVGDLLKWARIQHETLKSGRMKDVGAIDRPMTPEERAFLESILVELHQQFKQAVADYRGLKLEEVDPLADGRVFTGEQALKVKLVDQLGGFTEAVKLAAEMAGISGEPDVVYPGKRRKFFRRFMEESLSAASKVLAERSDAWQPMMVYSANE